MADVKALPDKAFLFVLGRRRTTTGSDKLQEEAIVHESLPGNVGAAEVGPDAQH